MVHCSILRSAGAWCARSAAAAGVMLAACFMALSQPAVATTVLAQSLADTVRQADAIVVGTVVAHVSRWGDASHRFMWTDYTLTVEDVVYPSERGVPIAGTIALTYWGGTIGNERQSISDLRVPQDGERVVVMLHSRWNLNSTDAPTVGFNQGYFSVVPDVASGRSLLRDGDGRALALGPNNELSRAATGAPPSGAMDLATFSGWLRANVGAIKATPPLMRPAADPTDPRILRTFAKAPVMPGLVQPSNTVAAFGGLDPASGPTAEMGAGVPAPSSAGKYALATDLATPARIRPLFTDVVPKYSFQHEAHAPIVVNNFPSSFTPWSPEDQYQLSKWNYYAANLFRVYTTPTGTYAWPDGVFDLAGWPSDADRQRVYGSSWYCGSNCVTLGITFSRYDGGGWIIEADILLNPAVSWTLDDEWVFDGGSATGFRQTMVHEMGHMHGLQHNFGFLALMNYMQPNNYRYYAMPYADDAEGVRAEYPGLAVARTDLGVYLYYETGSCFDGTNFFNCISEASFPASVTAGNSFIVNNYHVENVGTTTIGTPTIEWYLTAARNYSSAYYGLGTTTYSSLLRFQYFTPSSVGRSLSVPSGVPPGQYYLAAFVRNDDGAGQGGFPFSNNYAFSNTRIKVIGVTSTTLASSLNPSTYGATVTFTATVAGANPTGSVAFTDNGVAIAGCTAQAVSAGHATCATGALAVGAHPIVAAYGGDGNNTGSTSSTLTQTVNKAASSTALASSANPSAFGAPVTLTATISGSSPTGSVAFTDNGSTLPGCGAVAVSAAKAACVASGLAPGSHPMVASYSGDAHYTASTSATLSQVVSPPTLAHKERDYNGDGKGDVVWRSNSAGTAVWLMNGLSTLSSAIVIGDPAWSVSATGDLNGDGKTDLIWRNAGSGQTSVWLMNGTTALSSSVVLSDPAWSVVAVGDFDGNGKKDLVWRNGVTGATAIWLMNGLATASSAVVMSDPSWTVTATGDFNGDGKDDLVWRNTTTGQTALWLMNGLGASSSAVVLSDPNWTVTNVADFNGDGKSDLVWRNASTGQTAVWLMSGLSTVSSAVILGDPTWSVTFAPDLNGDGKADLVWRNATSGQTAAWLMNGLATAGSAVLPATPDWTVVSTVDANGDGKSDLVWRSTSTGQHSVWLMNGLTYSSFATVLGDPTWQVQNPRGGH
jgi:hypothetical protein